MYMKLSVFAVELYIARKRWKALRHHIEDYFLDPTCVAISTQRNSSAKNQDRSS